MNKSIFHKAAIAMTAMAMSLSLAACGDDDNKGDDDVTDNSISKVVVKYDVSLSETWYTFYDVQVTYANAAGIETTESIDMDWNYTLDLSGVEFPQHYACKVVAKPKAAAPAPVADEMYSLDVNINCSVMGYAVDGSAMSFGDADQAKRTAKTKGSSLAGTLDKEHPLINFVYDVK